MEKNLQRFALWAAGDLTGNRMRSLYAEWLLARRLGVLNSDSTRVEWDMADIRFGDILIEVKTSGVLQQWSESPTAPRFSIAPQKIVWDSAKNVTKKLPKPARTSHLYVFCLHRSEELTNSSVLAERNWQFWVVPTSELDAKCANQKSIGLSGLDTLAERLDLDQAVSAIIKFRHQG